MGRLPISCRLFVLLRRNRSSRQQLQHVVGFGPQKACFPRGTTLDNNSDFIFKRARRDWQMYQAIVWPRPGDAYHVALRDRAPRNLSQGSNP